MGIYKDLFDDEVREEGGTGLNIDDPENNTPPPSDDDGGESNEYNDNTGTKNYTDVTGGNDDNENDDSGEEEETTGGTKETKSETNTKVEPSNENQNDKITVDKLLKLMKDPKFKAQLGPLNKQAFSVTAPYISWNLGLAWDLCKVFEMTENSYFYNTVPMLGELASKMPVGKTLLDKFLALPPVQEALKKIIATMENVPK